MGCSDRPRGGVPRGADRRAVPRGGGDGCCGTVADGLAVLCALWGFYAGPDPAWALDMTVPRQVWLAVVLSVGWFAGGHTAPGRIIVL